MPRTAEKKVGAFEIKFSPGLSEHGNFYVIRNFDGRTYYLFPDGILRKSCTSRETKESGWYKTIGEAENAIKMYDARN